MHGDFIGKRPCLEVVLTVLSMLGVSQEHIENNGEDGCKDQDLKHEVIQGGPEKSDPALGRQRSSIIVSKLVRPLGKVFTVQTKFDIHAQFFGEALNA
jgi:hypothetical protein